MSDLPPISDLARALLAEERHTSDAGTSALRERVRSRLEAAAPGLMETPVALGHEPGGQEPGGGTGGLSPEGAAPSALAKPVTLAAGKLAALLAATFAVGAVTGAVVDRRVPRATTPPPISATATTATTAPPQVPTAAPKEDPSAVAAPTAPAPSVTASSAAPLPAASGDRKSDLARERALIDAARSGIAHGNPAAALDAVQRHAAAFPRGQLSEERDALRILALASLGRRDEAARHERSFRARFPESLFLPQIDAAMGPR